VNAPISELGCWKIIRHDTGGELPSAAGGASLTHEGAAKCVGIVFALKPDHRRASLRVEQHERTRMLAEPHRYALLALRFVISREAPARFSAPVLKHPFDAFVAGAGHAKVSRVNCPGNIEAVILLVPEPRSALGDLDGLARLRGLPSHGCVYFRAVCVMYQGAFRRPCTA